MKLARLWGWKHRLGNRRDPPFRAIEDDGAGADGSLGLNGRGEIITFAPRGFRKYRRDRRDHAAMDIIEGYIRNLVEEGHSLVAAAEHATAGLGIAGPSFAGTVEYLRKRYAALLK